MGIYSFKPRFQSYLNPIKDFLISNRIHPTALNVLGLFTSIFAGVLFLLSSFSFDLVLIIPILAFIRTALNALDGMVARELNIRNQEFGEVLNEFLDRVSDTAFFVGLSFALYTDIVMGLLTTILILLNSYLSIVSKAAGGKRVYEGFMGKADRMLYLSITSMAAYILVMPQLFDYFLIFTLIGTTMTILQRFFKVKQELYKD